MYARIQSLTSRGRGVEVSFRHLRQGQRHPTNILWRSKSTTLDDVPVALVGHTRNRLRLRNEWRSRHSPSMSSLHTTTQSLSSALMDVRESSEDYDEQDLEQDIQLFTSSNFANPPKTNLKGKDDSSWKHAEKNDESLDHELGITNAWDPEEEWGDNSSTDEDTQPTTQEATNASSQRPQRTISAREILRNFDPQNPPSSDDPEELQLWLECAAQQEAALRYQSLIDKARDRKAYDSMSLMQRHVVKWYQGLRDSIEIRQKEYLSNKDSGRAKKRYGPFLCSLHPEKMAVILAHEAITHSLLMGGKNGREGVPLIKIARSLGIAMETEVVSQRRLKERFRGASNASSDGDSDDETTSSEEASEEQKPSKGDSVFDRWKFSASHLKIFMEELQRVDPKMGKNKRAIDYAMRRAKQTMHSADSWTNEDLVHLGAALLMILIENATVNYKGKEEQAFHVEKRWSSGEKSTSYVVLNPNLHRMFTEEEFVSWAASTTRHTPMIVPPTNWTGPNEGGYRWLQVELMRTHGSSVQREVLQHGDLSQVCEGLNILGKTAWKINKDILHIGKTCWDRNIPIGDIPSRTDFEVPEEAERPPRIPPEIYADPEHAETIATVAANRSYRDNMFKRRRIQQKNMVSLLICIHCGPLYPC